MTELEEVVIESSMLPEVIPGLEEYDLTHHLDMPLPITWKFFTEQLVDVEHGKFIKENIFSQHSKTTIGEVDGPKWVLIFTIGMNERIKCSRCEQMKPEIQKIATELQVEQAEFNFNVA